MGVWDSTGKYLGRWAHPVILNLTAEHMQNPDKLVKYLEEVCCHPGNSRETQIIARYWDLATSTEPCSKLFSAPKRKGQGGNAATGTATAPAHPACSAEALAPEAVPAPKTSIKAATVTIAGAAPVSPAGTVTV